ncbi:AAA family ATPase [Paenibacillus sp. FA6]|uniref:AAA family ATPase n=1 Tax=Paenibacillus sp. FA6 TaxID=3413029 RepID=UPI003F65B5C8
MIFKNLKIEKWNQFEMVDITLNPRLTVITGANGAGKSTLLRLLGRLVGWGYSETATPSNIKGRKGSIYKLGRRKLTDSPSDAHSSIGSITLQNGQKININAPSLSQQVNYNITLEPHMQLKGLNIPSHRTAYSYKQITSIPVKAQTKNEAYNMFNSSLMSSFFGQYSNPPIIQMKSTIISLALFGKGNEYVQSDDDALELFLGFIEILRKLLPPTLGFNDLSVRNGEVILETNSGDFLLDAVSGGIGAILDLAWQIYMFEAGKDEPFFVLIDEAENHLHASMQRQLLPNLLSSFPKAQFIVTTHSPLMVNSVRESTVYALKYNDENAVISEVLDFENKAANASQILREVLGVPVTMPIWVEDSLNEILNKYKTSELTPEGYLGLKSELANVGLADHLPQALGLLQGGE